MRGIAGLPVERKGKPGIAQQPRGPRFTDQGPMNPAPLNKGDTVQFYTWVTIIMGAAAAVILIGYMIWLVNRAGRYSGQRPSATETKGNKGRE